MENWILRPAEPLLLYLAWQAPDHLGERHRWAVGVLRPKGDGIELRYLKPGAEFEALNSGKRYEQLIALGYRGYPGFNLRHDYYDEMAGVGEALMRRLPPPQRSDFAEYKRQFRIPSDLNLSSFALLGQTEAKLPSDGFSVVDPLDKSMDACDLMLEVAGHRYYAKRCQVEVGNPVELRPEPTNEHDRNAVMLCVGDQTIGYLNRLQAPTFLAWLADKKIAAVIERVNGTSEKPRLFVFFRVRPLQTSRAAA